ncbi:MAG: DegV family protein [Clostridia bacterium]|nr:DegV family protein [Clostridia bacterium]
MRKFKIVTDSSSNITELKSAGFSAAPLKIITDEREFIDDSTLDVDAMLAFFDCYRGKSKTSCPNVNDWLTAFGDADDVVCITITSALSGSYNSACLAKQVYEAEHPDRRVFVLDSLSAGPEIGLIAEKLEIYSLAGLSFEEICRRISDHTKRTGVLFMLKSMKNLANNGRVSLFTAKFAELVGICVVGRASNKGTLEPTGKCRGEHRAVEHIANTLQGLDLGRGRVRIAHCANETAAMRLKKMIGERLPDVRVDVERCRGLCSFYAERGGLLVGYEKSPV